jgi:predicted dehydrogenase
MKLDILLVGIGGYGRNYLSCLLDSPAQESFRIAGVVDPYPARCERIAEVRRRNIGVYSTMADFYGAGGSADLTVIASPIQFHASQTCIALERGSHVLCEKPLCATVEQAHRMLAARDRAGKQVAIGYQWSFSNAIQQLKSDIMTGMFGRPLRMRTLALWPRDEAYYARNRWAGALRDSRGNWVLDSPANNALAHYLHNMFYVLGPAIDRSAVPTTLTAELYRANNIQNYDTVALRCATDIGAEILFLGSHAVDAKIGPIVEYQFEKGAVHYSAQNGENIVAVFVDGSKREYGSPAEPFDRKLWATIDAILTGQPAPCGIEASLSHTACVDGAQQSAMGIAQFPPSLIRVTGEPPERITCVEGLSETLRQCYEQWKLPCEMGACWRNAKPRSVVRS